MANICNQCLSLFRQSISPAMRSQRPISILGKRIPNVPSKLHRSYATPSKKSSDLPADFTSLADLPPKLVRMRSRHGPGLIILALIPTIAFALGTWQVFRLTWKTDLIARFEDRLIRDPLPLPLRIDPEAIKEFDYRRVYMEGVWRHDAEMLIGPRMREGVNGYLVVTPLERSEGRAGDEGKSSVLICRGWISKEHASQRARQRLDHKALPSGTVRVEGLLREPWKKNMFTPDNKPESSEWFFPDVKQMAAWSGSQPVWVEETMSPDLIEAYDREAKGIPIGRPAEVNLRNNHAQYIFTWYSLSAATSIMMWMVVRKPASTIASKVRVSRDWA